MEPKIVELALQPYVGRRETITMTQFARVADHLPTMFARLGERGVPVAGAPFFRYRVIDMSADLVVEAGIPITAPVEVGPPMFVESLPAGRYATVSHIGHPDELMQVTARLLDWAREQDLRFDMHPTPTGEVWGCRLEVLMSNPAEEPDMHKWRTDLFFKLAD
ncbi:GyrI-like domain-containing protein [Paractinoplanes lichenicola]|uniref:GyrI-like domain-containing protein n=1 Tax=Paractinoplanes lichenicola TaxID=2802976 RepID=A0ABS1W3D6_9ACTN|nr:GyrI-like domain-containing protein [Actinoplanes lichenicola]MBL7261251.1 GyrI-like domain-containing protein [Actinoplanes lichenicola]